MATVAELYPANTDTNGRAWYRPAGDGADGTADGWTADPAQAHPSYAAAAEVVDEPTTLF